MADRTIGDMIAAEKTIRLSRSVQVPAWRSMVAVVGILIFSLGWLALMIWANSDAAAGRQVLHMDELLSFDGVERINNAEGFTDTFKAIVGPDQRYGRTFWYMSWLPSAVALPLFGESGQIVATRVTFGLMLFGATFIFIRKFVSSPFIALLAQASILTLPFAAYYATVPKPEPIMLLAFSLGFAIFPGSVSTSSSAYRLYLPFIFFGIAAGTKISALPVVLIFSIILYAYQIYKFKLSIFRAALIDFAGLIAGFLISVPFIATSPIKNLEIYLRQTWFNRGHGADNSSVNWETWIKYIDASNYFGPGSLTWIVIFVVVTLPLGLLLVDILRRSRRVGWQLTDVIGSILSSPHALPTTIVISGTLLNLAIIISVNRLWGMYLLPGSMLMLVGFWASVDTIASRIASQKLGRTIAASAAALGLWAGAFGPSSVDTIAYFQKQAKRSNEPAYIAQSERYDAMIHATTSLAAKTGRPVKVDFSPRLWNPRSTATISFVPIWGAYKGWDRKPHMVILDHLMVDPETYVKRGTDYDQQMSDAFAAVRAHTAEGQCVEQPCYRRLSTSASNLYIYVRDDLPALDNAPVN